MLSTRTKPDTENLLAKYLLTDLAERRAEYAKRNSPFEFNSVAPHEVADATNDGWTIYKEGKVKTRLRRAKNPTTMFEDETWCMFYRMGYPEITKSTFRVPVTRHDDSTYRKQLTIVARDDETVVVIECKFRDARGKRSLRRDLDESKDSKKAVQALVREQYGSQFKPKYLWLYVTRNVIWSESDIEFAAQQGIRVITENEFQYFDSFIQHLGPAGRYQFLAEYFQGQEIPQLDNVRVPATRGVFAKQKFYSFVTTPRQLLKIAFVNHQALNHPDGNPAYQRMISPSRVKNIEKFIQNGGYFPTNLLLNFSEVCRFDLLSNKENNDPNIKFGWLYLPRKYKSAWVIDGQHRLYGYSHLTGKHLDQPIPVIAFELMPVSDEANLFVTINHEQKTVPKSILVSLQADLKINSRVPKERISALASSISRSLNADPTSPFFQRCSKQGVVAQDNQSLTIPEFVNGIVRAGVLGRVVGGNHVPGPFTGVNDAATIARSKAVINGVFHALRDSNATRWDAARLGFVSTNPGVRAHLLLIAAACRHIESENIELAQLENNNLVAAVVKVLEPAFTFVGTASDEEIRERFSRKFGEGGVKEYFENLCELVCATTPTFGDDELRNALARKRDARRVTADRHVINLNRLITDEVFDRLREHFGSEELPGGKSYWVKGVTNGRIRSEAYSKQQQDKSPQPIEVYLDVLDLKAVIKDNFSLFQSRFNIQLPGEKRGKQYYLDWLDQFNELRRIPAHPSSSRNYSEDDYAFLKLILSRLMPDTEHQL